MMTRINRSELLKRRVKTSTVIAHEDLEEIKDFDELKLNDMIVVLDVEGHLECMRKFIEMEGKYIIIGNPIVSVHDRRKYDIEDDSIQLYKVKDSRYKVVQRRISIAHQKELVK